MTTTTRYALIDTNSGFVFGVTDATDPTTACRLIDESLHEFGRTYEEHGPRSGAERTTQGGYVVYEAPAGFDVTDGQDAEQIAAVEALPRVAIVLYNDAA
jgi:hypothetical protein